MIIGLVTLDDLLEVVADEMQAMAGAIGIGRARECCTGVIGRMNASETLQRASR